MPLSRKRKKQLKEAKRKYIKNKVHQVNIQFRNEDYRVIKAAADLTDLPVATFIRRAVNKELENYEI